MNLAREIESLRERVDEFRVEAAPLGADAGVDIDELVKLTINLEPLNRSQREVMEALDALDSRLGPEGAHSTARAELEQKLNELRAQLDEPRRKYEQDRQRLFEWAEARRRLVGSPTEDGTKEFLEAQLNEARTIPDQLQENREKRWKIVEGIHRLLLEKVAMYQELHAPVQDFLERHPLAQHEFSLRFAARLEIGAFTDPFLSRIDRGMAGSFYGREASESRVNERVRSVHPEEWDPVRDFWKSIMLTCIQTADTQAGRVKRLIAHLISCDMDIHWQSCTTSCLGWPTLTPSTSCSQKGDP